MAWQTGRALSHLCAFLLLTLLVTPYPGSPGPLLSAARPPGPEHGPGTAAPTLTSSATGGSWVRLGPLPTDRHLSRGFFTDGQKGWAVGEHGAIIKTSDGGATWLSQSSSITTTLTSMDFVDAQTGWAVGKDGVMVYTSNGGATWTPQSSGTTADLTSGHFLDASTGWAVGDRGNVLRYVPSYPVKVYVPLVSKDQSGGW